MFETRTKKYEEKLLQLGIEQGILADKQHVLIDLLSIKFGNSAKNEKIIKSVKNVDRLESALRKILTAQSSTEVMKCLG